MFIKVDGNAGFFLSVFNLMNAILGSGILGLSYAMAQLGIILFTIICGGVAGLALYAITLLLEMCKITKANVSLSGELCEFVTWPYKTFIMGWFILLAPLQVTQVDTVSFWLFVSLVEKE